VNATGKPKTNKPKVETNIIIENISAVIIGIFYKISYNFR
jgi:hypothetical protein